MLEGNGYFIELKGICQLLSIVLFPSAVTSHYWLAILPSRKNIILLFCLMFAVQLHQEASQQLFDVKIDINLRKISTKLPITVFFTENYYLCIKF